MKPRRPVTDYEREIIRAYYEHTPAQAFELADLAADLGRHKGTICAVAARMGLTRAVRPRSAREIVRMSLSAKAQAASGRHARGFSDKRHSADTRALIGGRSREAWERDRTAKAGLRSAERLGRLSDAAASMQAARAPADNRRHWRSGRRSDLGSAFFRSAWEANFARYLDALKFAGEIDAWKYEPERFVFPRNSGGVRSYLPDFHITAGGDAFFVEVKGWFCARSRRAARLMERHHPDVDLRFLDAVAYRLLEAEVATTIRGWERTA